MTGVRPPPAPSSNKDGVPNHSTRQKMFSPKPCEQETYAAHFDVLVREKDAEVKTENAIPVCLLRTDKRRDPPYTFLAKKMWADAIRRGASDIYLEHHEGKFRIRYRINGTVHELFQSDNRYLTPIYGRILMMSHRTLDDWHLPKTVCVKTKQRNGKEYLFRVTTRLGYTMGNSFCVCWIKREENQ